MTEDSLEGADLTKNTLDQIDLTGAHLPGAILSGATLKKVEFGRAELFGVDLSAAFLTDVRFGSGALLSGANMIGLTADQLKVPSGHLEGVGLQYSTIQKIDFSDANLDGADFFKANVPIDVAKYDKIKSLFYEMPADWDSNPKKQIDFADAVAKTVCAADITDTNNSKRVSKIVAAIITNSLYPRGGANACSKTGPNQCPPEQPTEYRSELADKLAGCVGGILTPEDIQSLKSGSDIRSHRR
jgi:hypothetical protein